LIPEDVRSIFLAVGLHRIILSSYSTNGGARETKKDILLGILRSVDAPI
jgi:hypothetical protein